MVWACDDKRGALRTNEGDGNESTREKEEMKTFTRWLDKEKDDIKEKGLSANAVYDRVMWRRVSSFIEPT